jgi:hypothetical protein
VRPTCFFSVCPPAASSCSRSRMVPEAACVVGLGVWLLFACRSSRFSSRRCSRLSSLRSDRSERGADSGEGAGWGAVHPKPIPMKNNKPKMANRAARRVLLNFFVMPDVSKGPENQGASVRDPGAPQNLLSIEPSQPTVLRADWQLPKRRAPCSELTLSRHCAGVWRFRQFALEWERFLWEPLL